MENWQELTALCETCGCSVRYAEPLRNHTTFRIGGNCGAFVSINSIETLRRVLALCREKQYPYLVLGNGSNVLAADSGYAGVILHLGHDFSGIQQKGSELFCESGATLARIGKYAGRIPDWHGVPGRNSRHSRRRAVYECRGIRR